MIDKYMDSNSGIKDFMKENKKFAHQYGYIQNYYGARMFYRKTKRFNPLKNNTYKDYDALKEFRTTTNFKIQSFNSFYLYKTLVPFLDEVDKLGLDISLMFTIYDSVMLRVNNNIDDMYLVDLLKKHFESDNNGFMFGIDVSRTPENDRSWYAYEDIELYSTKIKKGE